MSTFSRLVHLRRNAKRAHEVIAVLARYGLADWLAGLDYDWLHVRLRSSDGTQIRSLSHAARIKMALTELGTTFVKLGQIASTRPDIVGIELAEELGKLVDDTPADSPAQVAATIQQQLGRPLGELFAEFEPEPIASASIGQVHRARLPSGVRVAVKVQHHGVEERALADLDLLAGLCELAERHAEALRPYRPTAIADELARSLLREIDFQRELSNQERLLDNFAGDATVRFARVYPELTGRRVLTMELLEGVRIGDAAALTAAGIDPAELARRGATFYLRMIFRDGFYHADPHPGNFLVLEGPVLGVLDCGMVGQVSEELRHDLEAIAAAYADQDGAELTAALLRLGRVPRGLDPEGLRADVDDLLLQFAGLPLQRIDFQAAIRGILALVRRHGIVLPAAAALLLKTLAMLEGLGRRLDPQFRLAEHLRSFRGELVRQRWSPHRLRRALRRRQRDWWRLFEDLPTGVSEVLDRLRRGTMEIHLEHTRLEGIVERLVRGILAAALFLGSAQLWAVATPPLLFGVPIVGVGGCVLALWIGYRLLRSRSPSR